MVYLFLTVPIIIIVLFVFLILAIKDHIKLRRIEKHNEQMLVLQIQERMREMMKYNEEYAEKLISKYNKL